MLEEGSLLHSFLYPPRLAWRLAHRGHPVTVEVMEKYQVLDDCHTPDEKEWERRVLIPKENSRSFFQWSVPTQ